MNVKLKFLLILIIFITAGTLIHSNEKNTIQKNVKKIDSPITIKFAKNNDLQTQLKQTNANNLPYSSKKHLNTIGSFRLGIFLTGLFFTIAGAALLSGMTVLTYFSAEGLGFIDNPSVTVYFYNNDRSLGWSLLILGAVGIGISALLILGGIILIVAAFISPSRSAQSKIFIESASDKSAANFGIRYQFN